MHRLFALVSVLLMGWSGLAFAADKSLEIGYMPIIPVSQSFVVLEGDVLDQAGVSDPDLIKFQNGPAIVQALLAGQLDVYRQASNGLRFPRANHVVPSCWHANG